MGSLTSRPKVPQVQQPVFARVPAVAFAPPPPLAQKSPISVSAQSSAAASTVENNNPAVEAETADQTQSKARADNLLRRSRGRLGTVLTGFSGALSKTVSSTARKSLLGE